MPRWKLMDKRDIYEHLARIYLDASSKKKKRVILEPRVVKSIVVASVIVVVGITGILIYQSRGKEVFGSEVSLVLATNVLRLNFNFDPAEKEVYTLDLKNLDVSRYKKLTFSVKKAKRNDTISLRVEFNNAFNEKGVVYLKDIPYQWKEYTIDLSEFSGISDWSDMTGILFAIEEWNVRDTQGVVYIDDVRLITYG
ncbi:MAG: hypothetical protein MJA29_07155 [Candidatus Omnitrophica bacterium]|nr:hypothetical protein [Candidatus Omnitrophota bacterium]